MNTYIYIYVAYMYILHIYSFRLHHGSPRKPPAAELEGPQEDSQISAPMQPYSQRCQVPKQDGIRLQKLWKVGCLRPNTSRFRVLGPWDGYVPGPRRGSYTPTLGSM